MKRAILVFLPLALAAREKLRELDQACCLETVGIAPDGVRKEVAGGAWVGGRSNSWGSEPRTEWRDGYFGNTGLVRMAPE